MTEPTRVLLVDDEREVGELGAELLEAADAALEVTTATSVDDGLSALDDGAFDCVVSDYDMPGRDGIAFLEAVRERHGDLPFVLFTAKGSEEVASDALSAGATDYLQKERGRDQYELLANRVANAVEQRRARRRVRETRRQLESLARNTNEILWMFAADWSELRFINDAYEAIWGRPVEELRAEPTSFLEGVHPEDRDRVREAMAALSDGEAVDLELRVNDAEGYGRWVWVQGQPVADGDGEVEAVAGFARDVTERREREAELERERDRLSTLFENFPEPAVEYEFVDGEPALRAVNEAFVSTFRYGREEAVGSKLNDLVVPPGRRGEAEALDEQVRAGERLDAEVRRETGTGVRDFRIRNIATPAARSDGFAIYSDVTERAERERRLDQLRDRIQDLLYARTRDDAAAVAAEAAHEVIGAPLTGFHLLDDAGEALEPAGMIEAVEATDYEPPTYRRDAAEGTRSATVWDVYEAGETVRIDDTGAYEPLDEPALNRSVILSAIAGHGVCILAAPEPGAFDETQESMTEILTSFARTAFDRLEREGALRERERQLAHQNERLEEFAGVISHDLRNPLNVLSGSLEQAEESGDEAAFERARRAVDRMDELIDDMLTLARAGRAVSAVEPVDLGGVVDGAWGTVDTAEAELHNRAAGQLAADRGRLRQLLENLLANAVEHGGDAVTVTVGDLEDGFFVEDDGPGVPPEVRDEVFDSGVTTAPDGTGFGLAIVDQIASAHGWSVDIGTGMAGGARIEVRGVDAAA